MALTVTLLKTDVFGSKRFVWAYVAFDSSYPTGGESLLSQAIGLGNVEFCMVEPSEGYLLEYINSTGKLKVYTPAGAVSTHTHGPGTLADAASGGGSAHSHAVALDGGATGAGASHNHAFTGSALATHQHDAITAGTPAGTVAIPVLNIATDAFTGTGITAAGQVMTTTDNQTMTLNQCAGMWLYPVTGATPPVLILSNTAVTGAPAVFTVQGVAFTDVGVYHVIRNTAPTFTGSALGTHQHAAITAGTPAGTNAAEATHTHGAGNLTDAASGTENAHTHAVALDGGVTATSGAVVAGPGVEVGSGTDLSSLTDVRLFAIGT